ncbi:MAG: DUF1294 domain-containing protein [Acholeplasmataceae bacterium]
MPYFLFLVLFMSLLTYMLYGLDKYKSIKGKWRIKESTLMMFSLVLGALGGLIAMYQFRHKTKHHLFIFINWFGLIIHLGLTYYLYISELLFL